jgi:hypothetical protein
MSCRHTGDGPSEASEASEASAAIAAIASCRSRPRNETSFVARNSVTARSAAASTTSDSRHVRSRWARSKREAAHSHLTNRAGSPSDGDATQNAAANATGHVHPNHPHSIRARVLESSSPSNSCEARCSDPGDSTTQRGASSKKPTKFPSTETITDLPNLLIWHRACTSSRCVWKDDPPDCACPFQRAHATLIGMSCVGPILAQSA